jgi:hypothetical protein
MNPKNRRERVAPLIAGTKFLPLPLTQKTSYSSYENDYFPLTYSDPNPQSITRSQRQRPRFQQHGN